VCVTFNLNFTHIRKYVQDTKFSSSVTCSNIITAIANKKIRHWNGMNDYGKLVWHLSKNGLEKSFKYIVGPG